MRILICLSLLLLLQACSVKLSDFIAEKPLVCDLPYTRYQATVTGYCQERLAELPKNIPIKKRKIVIKPLSEIPEFFWYSKKMRYSIAKQEGAAPLAFIIAGTGAAFDSAKNVVLQKTLYTQGYHVIALSSPTFSNYIINTTDREGMIGDLEKDARSLYRTMQKIYAQVLEKDELEVTSFALTGYSLGGAHAAFVAKLDETEQHFNFSNVVMVNPPVSLYNSVSILDNYLDLKNGRDAITTMVDQVFHRFAHGYAEQESSRLTQDSIYALFKDVKMTEDELKMLIGTSFRMSSTDMMYAIELMYNIGALNYKNHTVTKFESISHSMYRADTLTFVDYFDKAMLPWTQETEPDVTRDMMIKRLSLMSIEDYLLKAEKISVVHNADDIILAEGEIEYLQTVFGSRAKIFERGGHCGNMDRVSFVHYMKQQFTEGRINES